MRCHGPSQCYQSQVRKRHSWRIVPNAGAGPETASKSSSRVVGIMELLREALLEQRRQRVMQRERKSRPLSVMPSKRPQWRQIGHASPHRFWIRREIVPHLPLNFHPAAVRVSEFFAARPNLEPSRTRVFRRVVARPNSGPPKTRFLRLCHVGRLVAPT